MAVSKEYITKLKKAKGVGKVTAAKIAKIYKTEDDLVIALAAPGPLHEEVQEHRTELTKIFSTRAPDSVKKETSSKKTTAARAKAVTTSRPKRVAVRSEANIRLEVRTEDGVYIFAPGTVLEVPVAVTKTKAFAEFERKLLLKVVG